MFLKQVLIVISGWNLLTIALAVSDNEWIPLSTRQNKMLFVQSASEFKDKSEAKILNEPFKEVIENSLVYHSPPPPSPPPPPPHNASTWPSTASNTFYTQQSVKVNPFHEVKPIPAYSYADTTVVNRPLPSKRKQIVESKKEPIKNVVKLPDLMPPQLMNRLFTVRASVMNVVQRIQGFIDMIWSFFATGLTKYTCNCFSYNILILIFFFFFRAYRSNGKTNDIRGR